MDRKRFEGKSIVVTGAATGIGRAAAIAFASEGGRVAVVDVNENEAQHTVSLIEKNGGEAFFLRVDVSSNAETEAMVAKTVERYGRLDVAFNNAAISGPPEFTLVDTDEKVWDKIIDIDLKSVFLCMKHEIRAMLNTGGGAIVNTASVAGLVGLRNRPAYVAAKHGVVGLTRAAALEYAASRVRINAICPGGIDTAMIADIKQVPGMWEAAAAKHPIARFGKPEEIASAALFLASAESGFMVGHPMTVDGGVTVQ
ncbi:SDR family oxidoreductase [Paraburkholderia oxyphila]|uniref:SDR family oxidoreductase n=1 Tax=Paraburkholderia oxyphila TaxID=614212 RepID=UPI000488851D|nr:SDR family oxidoreductase [Paraburkholderia oxyphila]